MKRILAFFFGLVLTLSIARVGTTDSYVSSAHICSSTGKVCMSEMPAHVIGDVSLGNESPRTIYFAKYILFNSWSMSPGNGDATSSHAQSVTSTPSIIANIQASPQPDVVHRPTGVYKLHLWASMASSPASVYFLVYAGSTVIATSSTFTVATGSLAAYDIFVTSTDYLSTSPSSDGFSVALYASSASTNNITIGYGGANATYVSAPFLGFAAAYPLAAGTAAPGTSGVPAQSDHVHPAQTDITGHAGGDLYLPTGLCSAGQVLTYLSSGAPTCVTNGSGTSIGCSGTCSAANWTVFADSTHITNASYVPLNPAAGVNTACTKPTFSGGQATSCASATYADVGADPAGAAAAKAVPGTCSAGQYVSATTTSGVTCSTPAGAGNVSTSGLTSGKIPKANGSTSLADSNISESGSVDSMSGTFKADVFQTNDTHVTINSGGSGNVSATGTIGSSGSYVYGTNIDSGGNTTGHATGDCRSDGYNCHFNLKGISSVIPSSGTSVSTSWTTIGSLPFSETTNSYYDVSAVATLQAPSFTGSTPATACCLRILLDTTQISMGFNSCGFPVTPSYIPSQPVAVTLPSQATAYASSGSHNIYLQAIEIDGSGYHGCDSQPYSVSLTVRDYGNF